MRRAAAVSAHHRPKSALSSSVASFWIAAADAAMGQVTQNLNALENDLMAFLAAQFATNPMPHASCSLAGWYWPCAGGSPAVPLCRVRFISSMKASYRLFVAATRFSPGARVANRPLPSIKYRESSSKLTLQKLDANKSFEWFPAAGKSSQRCFECLTNQASLILGQLRCAHGQVKHVDGLLSFGINQSHFDIAC